GFARKPKEPAALPFGDIGNYDEAVYVPSLSELLDACGDRRFFIGRFEEGGNFHVTYDGKKSECEGRTADEALAKFWLATTAKVILSRGLSGSTLGTDASLVAGSSTVRAATSHRRAERGPAARSAAGFRAPLRRQTDIQCGTLSGAG